MMDFFKNLKLLTKFQITIFFISTLTQALIGLTSYYEGRAFLEEKNFQFLENLTANKKRNLIKYFEDIQNQLFILAQNPSSVEALEQFKTSFDSIAYETAPTAMVNMLPQIQQYYEQDFTPKLVYNSLIERNPKRFIPVEKKSIILQYHYITNNLNPEGYRYKLLSPPEASNLSYAKVHQKYHNYFLTIAQKQHYKDVLLVDLQGNIIYSVYKRADFGLNIESPTLKNTALIKLLQKIRNTQERNKIFIEDYEFYDYAFFEPLLMTAIPLYDSENKKIGAIFIMLSPKEIDNILTKEQQWEAEGLGTSGEVALIGSDYKVRCNTRSIQANPLNYIQNLQRSGVDSVTLERIRRLNTTILLRSANFEAVTSALNGKTGSKANVDYTGTGVIDVYTPIEVLGMRWAMITEINIEEVSQSVYAFRNQLLTISFFIFIFQTILGFYLARGLSRPMLKIRDDIKKLSEGFFPKKSSKIYKDEMGEIDAAMNSLIDNTKQVAIFAENIGKGNFNITFESKGGHDLLGNSLIEMRENLQKVSQDEAVRSWINNGKALFSQTLRENTDRIETLTQVLIAQMVKYLDIEQGAFFIADDHFEQLSLAAAYAYDRQKYFNKTVLPGEGLVGQVFQEKEPIILLDIPKNYIEVSSGLGSTPPRNLLVMPLINEGKVYGIIELASLQVLEKYKIDFITEIVETIAITIASVKINEQTRLLLQETQKSGIKLKQQEELMRKNLDQLETAQEEMKKREIELQNSKDELETQNRQMQLRESIMRRNLEDLELKNKNLNLEIDKLQQEDKDKAQTLRDLQRKIQDIQSQLNDLENLNKDLIGQNHKMMVNENALKKAYLNSIEIEQSVRRQLIEREKEIEKLKNEINNRE
ncbi:MAG: GAF domain-containing protein [Cytophagales bacterium]|nr:MAG: GAF domain-containing protein [Cytophagales bacterium]